MSRSLFTALLALAVACGGPDAPPAPTGAATPAASLSVSEAAAWATSPAPGAPVVPTSAPTPTGREAADEAFNAAMRAYETGGADAGVLLPRAIAAYVALPDIDADGRYHLGLLQMAAGDLPAARATADRVLATSPRHLLALGAAAQFATAAGDAAAARGYHERLLAAYEAEQGAAPEYAHHARMLPRYRDDALRALASSGLASGGPD